MTYKPGPAAVRGVSLPFEVHVHVNPSRLVVDIAHKVYTDLLISAAQVAKELKRDGHTSITINRTANSDSENSNNRFQGDDSDKDHPNGVVCIIHSRRGDKLFSGYAKRDETARATTPEAVVEVVRAARPQCTVVYLATNEWDLQFYADSAAIKQSPVQFRQFHDFDITREMMLRCKKVKWPNKLNHLNDYNVNEDWPKAEDPRRMWAREKQRRVAQLRSMSTTVSDGSPPSLQLSERLAASLGATADAYRDALQSDRLDPSVGHQTYEHCESVMLYGVEQALALFVDKDHRLHTANTRSHAPSMETDLKKKRKEKQKNRGKESLNERSNAQYGHRVNVSQNESPNVVSKPQLRCIKQSSVAKKQRAIEKAFAKINGFTRAALFNSCNPNAAAVRHSTDIVYSAEHGFAYYDNVKAGSSTIRKKLQQGIQESWYVYSDEERKRMKAEFEASTSSNSTHYEVKQRNAHGSKKRTKSNAWRFPMGGSDPNAFVFSFVRDPVAKFESGCRQAWFQNEKLQRAYSSVDEMLDAQLALPPGKWLNEHLQPSTWRLTGWAGNGKVGSSSHRYGHGNKAYSSIAGPTVKMDYIGALESFDSDWIGAVGHMSNLTVNQVQKLIQQHWVNPSKLKPDQQPRQRKGSGGDGFDGGGGGRAGGVSGGGNNGGNGNGVGVAVSGVEVGLYATAAGKKERLQLSRAALLKMCQSYQYRDEWRCLGYQSPCASYTAPLCDSEDGY